MLHIDWPCSTWPSIGISFREVIMYTYMYSNFLLMPIARNEMSAMYA